MAGREHFHRDDVPSGLAILPDLLDHRNDCPNGYEPTEHGAWVAWDTLGQSCLASTEVAAVHIARGCVNAQRHGGLPLSVAGAVREAIVGLTGWWAVTLAPDSPGVVNQAADAYGSVEPVGLDPYHPDEPGDGGERGVDGCVGRWWAGPAWSPRRGVRGGRAALPDAPEGDRRGGAMTQSAVGLPLTAEQQAAIDACQATGKAPNAAVAEAADIPTI